jgi:hypothetical protein
MRYEHIETRKDAALYVMEYLARQADLYGMWMDPDWREIWRELQDLAQVSGHEHAAPAVRA